MELSKKKVDNKEILKDIKKYYEKFIHDTHKYKYTYKHMEYIGFYKQTL